MDGLDWQPTRLYRFPQRIIWSLIDGRTISRKALPTRPYRLVVVLAFAIGAMFGPAHHATAQDQSIEQQMQQLQQMMSDPAFKDQMRQMEQMMQQQGIEMPGTMQPGFFEGMVEYNNCLSNGLGSTWISSITQKMAPYIQHIQGLCQQGRQQAAAAFVNDPSSVERIFSRREITVLQHCEARFPNQAMLNTGQQKPVTGIEVCADF